MDTIVHPEDEGVRTFLNDMLLTVPEKGVDVKPRTPIDPDAVAGDVKYCVYVPVADLFVNGSVMFPPILAAHAPDVTVMSSTVL